jgi:hypothetical protein
MDTSILAVCLAGTRKAKAAWHTATNRSTIRVTPFKQLVFENQSTRVYEVLWVDVWLTQWRTILTSNVG